MDIYICQSCGHIVHSQAQLCEACNAPTAGNIIKVSAEIIEKVSRKFSGDPQRAAEMLKSIFEEEMKSQSDVAYSSAPAVSRFGTNIWGRKDSSQTTSSSFMGLLSENVEEPKDIALPPRNPDLDTAEHRPEQAPQAFSNTFGNGETDQAQVQANESAEPDPHSEHGEEGDFASRLLKKLQEPPAKRSPNELMSEFAGYQQGQPKEEEYPEQSNLRRTGEHQRRPDLDQTFGPRQTGEFQTRPNLDQTFGPRQTGEFQKRPDLDQTFGPKQTGETRVHPQVSSSYEMSWESEQEQEPAEQAWEQEAEPAAEQEWHYEPAPANQQVWQDEQEQNLNELANNEGGGDEGGGDHSNSQASYEWQEAHPQDNPSVSYVPPDKDPFGQLSESMVADEHAAASAAAEYEEAQRIPSPEIIEIKEEPAPETKRRRTSEQNFFEQEQKGRKSYPKLETFPQPGQETHGNIAAPDQLASSAVVPKAAAKEAVKKGQTNQQVFLNFLISIVLLGLLVVVMIANVPRMRGPAPQAAKLPPIAAVTPPPPANPASTIPAQPAQIPANPAATVPVQPAQVPANPTGTMPVEQTPLSTNPPGTTPVQPAPLPENSTDPIPVQPTQGPPVQPAPAPGPPQGAAPTQQVPGQIPAHLIERTEVIPAAKRNIAGKWEYGYQNPSGSTGNGIINITQSGTVVRGYGTDTNGEFQIKGVRHNDVLGFDKLYVKNGAPISQRINFSGKLSLIPETGRKTTLFMSGIWRCSGKSNGKETILSGPFEGRLLTE